VGLDVSRRHLGGLPGHPAVPGEDVGKGCVAVGREHEHLQGNVLLKGAIKEKIDQFACQFRIPRPFENPGKLDLAESRPVGKYCRGGSLAGRLLGKVDLGRRARSVTDDDGPVPLGCSREVAVVGVFPAVGDQDGIGAQAFPETDLPVSTETADGGQ
jgi:hypothetical protein